jgi:hypothetical protein
MKIPGLKQLAGTALINSPLAPPPVKAYAKTLVEGLILDTITKQVPITMALTFEPKYYAGF